MEMEQDEQSGVPSSSEESVTSSRQHRRSVHAEQRRQEGRRVAPGFRDAQQARLGDLFIQNDGRYVVRGPRSREHVFDVDGTHITSVDRSRRAHYRLVGLGKRMPATPQQFQHFKGLLT